MIAGAQKAAETDFGNFDDFSGTSTTNQKQDFGFEDQPNQTDDFGNFDDFSGPSTTSQKAVSDTKAEKKDDFGSFNDDDFGDFGDFDDHQNDDDFGFGDEDFETPQPPPVQKSGMSSTTLSIITSTIISARVIIHMTSSLIIIHNADVIPQSCRNRPLPLLPPAPASHSSP